MSSSDAWDVVGTTSRPRLERTETAQAGFERRYWDAGPYPEPLGHGKPALPEDPNPGEAHPIDPKNGGCATCPKPAKVSGDAQAAAFKSTTDTEPRWFTTPDSGNPKDAVGDLKPPLHLVPAALTIQVSQAMKNGAAKYGPYNWREKKVRAHVYIAAAQRHLAAWFDGENVASDSGVHHLAHAAACLAILLDAEATGNLIDDRPPHGAAGRLIDELTERAA